MKQRNEEADADEHMLRISLDAKATVKIGPFARGGKSRVQPDRAMLGHFRAAPEWGLARFAGGRDGSHATSMAWKGKHPVVSLVTAAYQTGAKLTKQAMQAVEIQLQRLPHLDKWFVDIASPSPPIQDS